MTVFVVQALVAFATMLACAVVLASVFSHLPMWDDAVDGDLVSLVTCLRFARLNLAACAGIVFGAVLLWQLASKFLVGGVYGVLSQRPEGRAETARTFGASGTATYLAYARLALCSLPGYLVVLFVFAICTGAVAGRLARVCCDHGRLYVPRVRASDVRRRGRDHAVRDSVGRLARADGAAVRRARRSGRPRWVASAAAAQGRDQVRREAAVRKLA